MRCGSAVVGAVLVALLVSACQQRASTRPPPPMPDLDSLARVSHPALQGARREAVVDEPPAPLDQPPAHYPADLRAAGIQGWVVLEFVIDTAGRPEPGNIRVLASSHQGFEVAAVEAILRSRYRPGRIGGVPVRVLVMRSVNFAIQSETVEAEGSPIPRLGISFAANVPAEPLGVGFWYVPASRIGIYGDVKTGVPIRNEAPNFFGDLTIDEVNRVFGDPQVGTDRLWGSVNLALTKAVSNGLAVYAGGGVSVRYEFLEYRDRNGILVDQGDTYWIEDDDRRAVRPNVLAGALVRLTPWMALQVGGELQPPGATVGLGFRPPRRQ